MEKENKRKKGHLVWFILFPIAYIILAAVLIFLFDLLNGPTWLFVLELVALAGLALASIIMLNKALPFRFIPWGAFFLISAFCISMSKPGTYSKPAYYYDNPVYVESPMGLKNGKVQGVYNKDGDVEIYAGIPYAKPPVGPLRWKEPQNAENWSGVKDCTHFAPRSMQPTSNPVMNTLVEMYSEKGWHPDYVCHPDQERSEDSLYLNIWKPKGATNAPILVYIHGGSLTSGTTGFNDYNGEALAKTGVIQINVAYRLGVFGFFAHEDLAKESPNNTTGNYGLLDQIKALEWVKDNASYFGGDASNITIAGESAGSSSVSALCSTPLLRGKNIIKNAIGESSSLAIKNVPHTFRKLSAAKKTGQAIMEEFGCESIDELRLVPAEELVKTSYSNSAMTLDGYALDQMPYDVYKNRLNNEKNLLNGYNVKEADAFVVPTFLTSLTSKDNIESRLMLYFGDEGVVKQMMELYKDEVEKDAFSTFNEIISVYWFMHPHRCWSELALEAGDNVYKYQFTKENGYYGTYHSGEMVYCYGSLDKSIHGFAYNESDFALSKTMVSYWSNFAKTGNPNGEGLPNWAPYTGKDEVLELGDKVFMREERYLKLYDILDSYTPKEA
ncbi:MAG: carboxylesterase family protein [Bacilli bacterium]|nr:carboxylesterase family protein [Bacilli bacterium]